MSRRSLKDIVRDWKTTLKESDGIKKNFKRGLKGKRPNAFAAVVENAAKASGEDNADSSCGPRQDNNRFGHQPSYI